jgi:transposase
MTWRPKKLTAEQREERRLEAGRLLRETDPSQAEIARIVGVSRTAVTKWKQQMKQSRRGLASLKNCPRAGRPPRLTAKQWRQVLHQLQRGAQPFGYETERWTLGRIQQLIKQKFGITYNANYLSEKLRRFGWSPQQPAVYAKERDEELIAAWLRQD